jgi:DNA-binding transcriptional MocR family regulator
MFCERSSDANTVSQHCDQYSFYLSKPVFMTSASQVTPLYVTSGGLEAINLGLRAVANPGDVIAVESPTYFGFLGSATSLNMKVIEIPTHPQCSSERSRVFEQSMTG